MASHPIITSLQNPSVKGVVQLHQRKYREKTNRILIEGRHPIEEAFQCGVFIEEIYLKESEKTSFEGTAPQVIVTDAVMSKMATTESPPPMLAVAKRPVSKVSNTFEAKTCFILGLIGLQDPGNLGTIIRSACAFNVNTILTIGDSVDVYSPKVIRASAGQIFRLPITSFPDITLLAEAIKDHPELQVFGADAHQGKSYKEAQYTEKILLLLGSEAHGIPPELWQYAKALHIPTNQAVESLNVGIAGAVMMAEIYHQRFK